MPGASAADAEALTRRAATALAGPVTFSWGLALTAGRDWEPAVLLRSADIAQYEAKRSGGDCLRTALDVVAGPVARRPAARTRDRALLAARIMKSALEWLDGPGRGAPVAERVGAVAEIAAATLDASAWSISAMAADASCVITTAHEDRRQGASSVVERPGGRASSAAIRPRWRSCVTAERSTTPKTARRT